MSKKLEILKHIGKYSFAAQMAQVIGIVTGILTRNFLGPFQMGILSTVYLILDYAKYTTLGTTKATIREIPYFLGKGDTQKADEIKDLVASFATSMSVVTALGVLLAALFLKEKLPNLLFWGILTTFILIILQRLNNLLIDLLRAYKKFEIASSQTVFSAVVNLLLILGLAYPFKLYGLLVAMILSFLFNIIYIYKLTGLRFHFVISKKIFGLIAFGLPLMFIGVLSTLLRSIDKIIILRMLGFEAMGLYSVAVMAASFLGQIPNSMAVVMIPHLQEKYGNRDSADDVKGYIDKAAYAYSILMPILIGCGWIASPLLVAWILPQYVGGVSALKFLILSSFFVALSLPYGNFIITLKKHLIIFPLTAVVIGLAVFLNVAAVKMGYGIRGVALAATISLFFNYLLLFLLAARYLYSFKEGFVVLVKTNLKFLLMLIFLFLLDLLINLPSEVITVSLRLSIFTALSIPLLLRLNKKFGLFDLVKQKMMGSKQYE